MAAAAAVAAVDYPPWVLLPKYDIHQEAQGSSSTIADPSTLAACYTSSGNPISVGLCVAAPPETSRVCVQVPTGVLVTPSRHSGVLAAHGDSLLIAVTFYKEDASFFPRTTFYPEASEAADYFVYSAGNAAADPPRPPSLLRLPPPPNTWHPQGPRPRDLDINCTGLLRRGEDEFVVAQLEPVGMVEVVSANGDTPSLEYTLELVMFRSGEWSVTPLRFSHDDGTDGRGVEKHLCSWQRVVPVRDSLLCWSDLRHGVIFSDVFAENPTLRYVPFPVESAYEFTVAGAGDTVKLVSCSPRCCCGEEAKCRCRHSCGAFTLRTWTLRMDDMTWVMDAMVDATELWALEKGRLLPPYEPSFPIVSLDDPYTIIFMIRSADTLWLVTVDTRSKSIPSALSYPIGKPEFSTIFDHRLPSKISSYLSSHPPCQSKVQKGSTDPPQQQNDAIIKSSAPSSCNVSAGALASNEEVTLEVLTTLEEIPGLAREEMLKAYSILVFDNGRRFRSLLKLPMKLRKDWLLMEIKASEACSTCSACTKT